MTQMYSPASCVNDLIAVTRPSHSTWSVAALCAGVMVVDGFDTQAIGYVAPAIIQAWGVDRTAMAPAFSSGLVGVMIGALCLGTLADKLGRRRMLIACTGLFGLFSLLTATSTSLSELLIYRLVTGVWLGGAMPNAVALTTEYASEKRRTLTVMLMFAGFSLGAALGGVVAGLLVARSGWTVVFVVGGIIPLCLVAVLAKWLPESTHFVGPAISQPVPGPHRRAGQSEGSTAVIRQSSRSVIELFRALFENGRMAMTLSIWTVFFMNLLALYFLSNWLPLILTETGATFSNAAIATGVYQLGGTVGTLVIGTALNGRATFRRLAGVYACGSCVVLLLGVALRWHTMLFVFTGAAGFCVIGAQIAANALTVEHYPPDIRATGIGWALGVGRIGSIVGPLIGASIVTLSGSDVTTIGVAGFPLVIAACAAVCVDLFRPQRVGEPRR